MRTMITTGATRPIGDWLTVPSSILPPHITHPIAVKPFLNKVQKMPQPPLCSDAWETPHHPFLTEGHCGLLLLLLRPAPRGAHCSEQSGNKLLSVRSTFIFLQPDERLSGFQQPFQMWGAESHIKHADGAPRTTLAASQTDF